MTKVLDTTQKIHDKASGGENNDARASKEASKLQSTKGFDCRCSPSRFVELHESMGVKLQAVVAEMGFSSLIEMDSTVIHTTELLYN